MVKPMLSSFPVHDDWGWCITVWPLNIQTLSNIRNCVALPYNVRCLIQLKGDTCLALVNTGTSSIVCSRSESCVKPLIKDVIVFQCLAVVQYVSLCCLRACHTSLQWPRMLFDRRGAVQWTRAVLPFCRWRESHTKWSAMEPCCKHDFPGFPRLCWMVVLRR